MSKKMITCLTALSFAVPVLAAASPADAKGFSKVRSGGGGQFRTASRPTASMARTSTHRFKPSGARSGASAKTASKPKTLLGGSDGALISDAFKASRANPTARGAADAAVIAQKRVTDALKGAQGGNPTARGAADAAVIAQKHVADALRAAQGNPNPTQPAKPDPGKPDTGGMGDGKGKGDHAGKWPQGPWVYGEHRPHIVEYAPSRRTSVASPVAQAVPPTDPVCVQGTWAEQEEKKVYVCLSWYFRGRLLTPDQLAQVLAQQLPQ
jgi:hypothetical protein